MICDTMPEPPEDWDDPELDEENEDREVGEEPAVDGGQEITEHYLRQQGVHWDNPQDVGE